MTSNRSSLIKLMARALVTLAVVGLIALAGWLVVRQFNPQPQPGAQEDGQAPPGGARLGGAEGWLLGLYLSARQGELNTPAGKDDTPVEFTIGAGESVTSIAARLAQQGLIRDATLFRYYVRYHGLDAGIEAGKFTLRQTMTMQEIADRLGHALSDEVVFRTGEGWRMEQIADALAKTPGLNIAPDDFLRLAGTGHFDYDFLAERPVTASLEGFLFPDTYRLDKDTTAEDLINKMLTDFGQRVTPEIRHGIAGQGLTLYQGLILASIVEREARIPEERPLIASVYLNRLKIGMKLDADPTVQYALGFQKDTGEWWKKPLLLADLDVDSPYNTYRYPGLPPGPIANPGLASIQAVAQPAQTDFLYFQAECDGSGRHRFARTFEEHAANSCTPTP